MEAEGLLDRAKQIRDEKEDGANTALRVGGLIVDMVKSFGNQSFEILGHYNTLEELKLAFPDGPTQKGLYAVGEKPYNYYAYYDGDWQDQGKLIEELTVYKSSLSFSTIVNDSVVTQEQITEMSAIYTAWKAGKMVYVVDEEGNYFNLGVLNMQIADDNTEVSFVVFDQLRQLCVFRCEPSVSQAKWSVYPVGEDLFALIQHTHAASDITEQADKRFMTDAEKTKLGGIDLSLYAKSDLSNAMTVSLGANGYAKFNNGLLIQWGYNSGAMTYPQTIYMPTSFSNTNYIVSGSIIKGSTDNNVYTFCPIMNFSVSSFKTDRNFASTGGTGGSSAQFNWVAIGRWK